MSAPVPSSANIPIRNAFQAGVSTVAPGEWNIDGMLFDAWLRLNHNTSLTITQHPVETGASISDHSFVNPKRFSFDIGMSDVITAGSLRGSAQNLVTSAMDTASALANRTLFAHSPSRSINAYNELVQMQAERRLLTLVCKYGIYQNVLIESIDATDDFQTQTALKATVNLVELIIADKRLFKVTQNPHATDKTNRGRVSAVPALGTWERVVYDWNKLYQ